MTIAITDASIAAAARRAAEKKQRAELIDASESGLHLRVTPSGVRTWSLVLRDTYGAVRRHQLGAYPTVGIAAAREAARTLRHAVRHANADPTKERRRRRAMHTAAQSGEGTLRAVLEAYSGTQHASASWAKTGRKAAEHVFSELLDRPALALTLEDFIMAQSRHPSLSTCALATRSIRPALKWAVAERLVIPETTSIRADFSGSRDRYLNDSELTPILKTLIESNNQHHRALLFLLLSMARLEEVTRATWAEFDLDQAVWTIPAKRVKTKSEHRLDLPTQAVTLLRNLHGAGKASGIVFKSSKSGAVLSNWDRVTKVIQAKTKTANWHRHDLRRTGATVLAELQTAPHIIEQILNHKQTHTRIAAVYDRSKRRAETKAALQLLADHYFDLAKR